MVPIVWIKVVFSSTEAIAREYGSSIESLPLDEYESKCLIT